MSNLRQAAQSFVDCWDSGHFFTDRHAERIRALRAALAEPEHDPVAWAPQVWRQFRSDGTLGFQKIKRTPNGEWEDYSDPPKAAERFDCTDAQLIDEVRRRGFVIRDAQIEPAVECICGICKLGKREWVGLTDNEIQDMSYLSEKCDASNAAWFDRWGFARAVEQALKEKNHG